MIKKKHTSFSYLAEIHYLYPHITIPESTLKKIDLGKTSPPPLIHKNTEYD